MRPDEALENLGRRQSWVAEQMGISESYLSMLISGKRAWTADLRQLFTRAIGIRESAILFAPDCTSIEQKMTAERTGTAQERVLAAAMPDSSFGAENGATEPIPQEEVSNAAVA